MENYWRYTTGRHRYGNVPQAVPDLANNDYFKMLPARIGASSWNHISITIIFETIFRAEAGSFRWSMSHSTDE
ncbi:MAG: hypothetical protein WDO16_17055 [Bacteroidota bacterium]